MSRTRKYTNINLHNQMTLKNTNLTVLSKSANPQNLASQALHVCYSEMPLSHKSNNKWGLRSEARAGKIVVDKCLKFGHWSILEMPHITFNVEGFPNSTMVQSRTHRHISHQCQCMSGDSMIKLWNLKEVSIKDLFEAQERGEKTPWLKTYRKSINGFLAGEAAAVIQSGVKPVYEITLEGGYSVKSTKDHRFLTTTGWKRLGNITTSDEVLTNGLKIKSNNFGVKKECQEARKFYTDYEWLSEQVKTKSLRQDAAELGVSYEVIKKYRLLLDVPYDFKKYKNLSQNRGFNSPQIKAKGRRVLSITYVGMEMTYDISMKNEPHNFIANGIVVHNSQRYTGKRLVEWALRYGGDITSSRSLEEFEKLFYIREMGVYQDRFGNKIDFDFNLSMAAVQSQAIHVAKLINAYLVDEKMPFEMFRSFLPADYRSNWVMGGNLRAWLHYLDMRGMSDAQGEINHLANLVAAELEEWCPEVMEYYNKTRRNKNKLSP